jgi:hypothetical protein
MVTHAVVGAAPRDLGSALASGAALTNFGGTIARAGEVAGEFSQRLQAATNAAAEVDAQVKMHQAQDDYNRELSTNQDTNTWVPGWQKKVDGLRSEVLGNPELSPMARDKLTNQFKSFAQTSTSQVATQSNVQGIRNKTKIMLQAADNAWDSGDYEAGTQPILSAVQVGLLSDAQAQEILKKGETQADFAKVNRGLNVDPINTLDSLNDQTDGGRWRNFKGLDENQREALKGKADTAVNKLRGDTLQGIYDKQNNGQLMSNDDLQQLVDDRKLTPGTMKAILAQQAKIGKRPEVPELERYSNLLTSASNYNPDSDPNNEQRANIIAQMAELQPTYRDEVKASLDRATNKTGENARTADGNNYIDELVRGGFLGNTKLAPDGSPYEPAQARQAYQRKIELRDALRDYIRTNPKATAKDQFEFLNGKISTQIDVGSATPILNSLTGRSPGGQSSTQTQKVTSKAQWDALAPGTLYIGTDGQTYKKRQ